MLDTSATKAMSSAYLKSFIASLLHKMLLEEEKRLGDKTQPWGSPVFKVSLVDLIPLKDTCWGLSSRKLFVHRVSVG